MSMTSKSMGLMALLCATWVSAGVPVEEDAAAELDAAKPELPDIEQVGFGTPAAVELRGEAIERELAVLPPDHPWAGRYYLGDGLGANLRLSITPVAGFAVTWRGCVGTYGANEGPVIQAPDGTLVLDFRWRNHSNGFGSFPRRLLPMQWGERHYLVDADDIASFVNAINLGFEPRVRPYGATFLRAGDEKRPVHGLPPLSEPWRSQLSARSRVWAVSHVSAVSTESLSDDFCSDSADVDLIAEDARDVLATGMRLKPLGLLRESDGRWPGDPSPVDEGDRESEIVITGSSPGRATGRWGRSFYECGTKTALAPGVRYETGSIPPEWPAPSED
jgi:hypothetical protein